MQFPLNLKHLISDCNLGFSYNYSFWFQVYTDWKDISEVIRSSLFEEDQQDLIDILTYRYVSGNSLLVRV